MTVDAPINTQEGKRRLLDRWGVMPMVLALVVLTGCLYPPEGSVNHADTVSGREHQLKSALALMVKDIRNAGYDPQKTAGCGILTAAPSLLTFTLDRNGDGDLTDDRDPSKPEANEQIRYTLNRRGVLCRGDGSREMEPVLENIEALRFVYLNEEGKPADRKEEIRAVKVTLISPAEANGAGIWPVAQPAAPLAESSAQSMEGAGRIVVFATAACRNVGLPSWN